MLELRHISHSFPGVKALRDISIRFETGEVHAVCGENGAGKSTLMNIISGNLQADHGQLFLNEEIITPANVSEAQKLGISIVYQERSLVDSLSVAENIFPVNQPRNKWGLIDRRQLHMQTKKLLDKLGLSHIPVNRKIQQLSAAQKQLVEIAKALATKPSLLILDEPTASLANIETAILFRIIRELNQQQVSVIYISHRMAEIKEIANRVSVLKDGQYQGCFDTASVSVDFIISKMVGRELANASYRSDQQDEILLEVKNLSGDGFKNIDFNLRKGEIIGFAGLQGSGRTALMRTIFGDLPVTAGTIRKEQQELSLHHPADSIAAGMAYIPDDRKALGLFMDFSITENIASTQLENAWYKRVENKRRADAIRGKLSIRSSSSDMQVNKLSGGNQQKVILGKWMDKQPDILIINEPTHGVDVGAKAEIYAELKKMTAAGKSILLLSGELSELLLLSDRIAVLYKGNLQGILNREEASEERIARLASGMDH